MKVIRNLVAIGLAAGALSACGGGIDYIPASSGGNAGTLVMKNAANYEMAAFVNPCQNRDSVVMIGGSKGPRGEVAIIAPGGAHKTPISQGCYWVTYGPNKLGMGGTFVEAFVDSGKTKTVNLR